MAKKSYKPQDNELPQVNEPVAAYHVTTPNANLYVPTEYEQERRVDCILKKMWISWWNNG